MDYRHFRRLLERKLADERSDLALLQDFVRDYPYCQTGHLLLTGAMHIQDHVGYDQQLRRTAACLPDRTALFNLIHGSSSVATGSPLTVEPSPFSIDESLPEVQVHAPVEDASSLIMGDAAPVAAPASEQLPESKDLSHLHDFHPSESVTAGMLPEPLTEDPQEIFRRKLEQILGEQESPVGEPESKEPVASQEPSTESTREESSTTGLEQLELGHVLEENFLKELEKLPSIPAASRPEPALPVAAHSGPTDFFGWLKTNTVSGFGQFELIEDKEESTFEVVGNREVSFDEKKSPASPKGGDLIERFIQSEPRIVPQPKPEFFNPSMQAKRSVEEHEDLVSETLAKIYADQGNLLKARTAYERLRLLHPEKNAYFAALVRKIDNQLNSTSEDL